MLTVKVELPAGTAIDQNFCEPLLPEMPVTGTPLVNGVAPLDAVTVNDSEVVCVALAAEPVIVNEYVPGAAVPALTERVDEPPAVTDAGLSDADAPAGNPETLRATDCAEPDVTAVLTVDVPEVPCTNDNEVGDALIEKSFGTGAVTVNDNDVE
jgi:hypothetical protein